MSMTRDHDGAGTVERLPTYLLGPRVLLRPYELTDTRAVWEALEETRSSLTRWVPDIGARQTPEAVRAGLAEVALARQAGRCQVFGVWSRRGNWFLGEVGLYSLDRAGKRGEVGYWLRASARGRGFVTEAMQLLLDQLLGPCGLQRVEAHVAAENAASRRVAERLGFRVGEQREADPRWDGAAANVLIYFLLAKTRGLPPVLRAG